MKTKILFALLASTLIPVLSWAQGQNFPGSSSGSTSSQAPILGYYLGNICLSANTGKCFFTPANTIQVNDANWTNASTTVTFGSAHTFSVGMNVMGGTGCASDTTGNPGVNGQISTTTSVTIATVNGSASAQNVSATTITLSATPANSSGAGNTNCFIYGSNDDTGAAAVDTAIQADLQCQRLHYLTAGYFFKSPHHFTQPNACAQTTPIAGGSTLGNITLPAGFEWVGTGPNPTTIFLDPAFPNGDACTHKSTSLQSNGGCFAIPLMGKLKDLQFNGGPQFQAPNMANKVLITAAVNEITNVTCLDYGAFTGGAVGLNLYFLNQLNSYNNAGCGSVGLQTETGVGGNVGVRVYVEDSAVHALVLGTGSNAFTCYSCYFTLPSGGASSTSTILNNGGTLRMFGGVVAPSNFTGGSNTSVTLYRDAGGGALYADSTIFDLTNAPTNNQGLWCNHANCIMSLVNGSTINATGGLFAYQDFSGGGTLNLDRSFTWTGPFSDTAIAGSISAGNSLFADCTGTASASLTLGLYGTGPNATTTTCSSTTIGSGIISDSPRSAAAILCTSSATTVSVACKLVLNGTPSASLLCTMTAATHCENYTAVAISKGDLISAEIVTGAAETGANIKVVILWQ